MIEHEEDAFRELSHRLVEKGLSMDITVAGGYALSRHGLRATRDIDAFYPETGQIAEIIWEVGEMFGLNQADEPWLNNSVQNMNEEPPKEFCEEIYLFPALKVRMPPLEYVMLMKLSSAREKDISDVAAIIRKKGMQNPHEVAACSKKFGMPRPDEDLVLEAFGRAYGMKWLENYYIQHEKEIMDYAEHSEPYCRNMIDENSIKQYKDYSR